jgi:hypothetical protein
MTKALHNTVVPNTCGVGVLGIFRDNNSQEGGHWIPTLEQVAPITGCGWVIAGFTNQKPVYRQAYLDLRKRWKLVYQSPVRVNTRTGRKFFFCIFDSREKP